MTKQGWAKLAAIYSGLVFGVYWIPLRAMESAGFSGLWSVLVFNLVSLVLVLPLIGYRWRQLIPGRLRLHFGALTAGCAFVLYAGAFLYTEVVRVIVLFYLLPIWGFLLARVVSGDKISAVRWVSMLLGLGGMAAICGFENGLPLPSNIGDWMALAGGMLWAVASMIMLLDQDDAVNYTIGFVFWSTIVSALAALISTRYGFLPEAQWSGIGGVLVWLIPFAVIVIVPAAFATIFGPSQLNPGVVGLLFMTEISVGTITAAILAGEPFGPQEITGVLLITLAGVAEPIYQQVRPTKTRS